MKTKIKILLVFLVILCPLLAAAKTGLGISPGKIALELKQGEKIDQEIGVTNVGDQKVAAKIYIEDYFIKEDNSFEYFPAGSKGYSAAEFIKLEKDLLEIEAGKTEKINFSITIPEDQALGTYSSVIFIETVPDQEENTGVATNARLGARIDLAISDKEGKGIAQDGKLSDLQAVVKKRQLFIKNPFKINFKNIFSPTILEVSAIFKNTGNSFIVLSGGYDLNCRDFLNREINKKITIEEITSLPDTKRKLEAFWEGAPIYANCKILAAIEFLNNEGRSIKDAPVRTAEAEMMIFDQTKTLLLGISGLILLAFLVLLAKVVFRRRKRGRIIARAEKTSGVSMEEKLVDEFEQSFEEVFGLPKRQKRGWGFFKFIVTIAIIGGLVWIGARTFLKITSLENNIVPGQKQEAGQLLKNEILEENKESEVKEEAKENLEEGEKTEESQEKESEKSTEEEEFKPPKETSGGIESYKVEAGDTLGEIAKKFNVSLEDLAKANNLEEPYIIYVGQVLKISSGQKSESNNQEAESKDQGRVGEEQQTYTIQDGDTLGGIAVKFNTTIEKLQELNNIEDPNMIMAGQKLIIPGE